MRNPTRRSLSSSSRASTSSIRASESASRSSAKLSPSVMVGRLDLEDVREAVADQLEHLLAVHGSSFDVGLGGHGGSSRAALAPGAYRSRDFVRL